VSVLPGGVNSPAVGIFCKSSVISQLCALVSTRAAGHLDRLPVNRNDTGWSCAPSRRKCSETRATSIHLSLTTSS